MVELVKNKLIKDLHWITSTPSLSNSRDSFEVFKLLQLVYKQTANNWEKIPDTIVIKHKNRLGVYAEEVLKWALELHPDFQVIATGKQIMEEGKTIGELDFIFEYLPNHRFYHLELAVKFYLNYNNSNLLHNFIGPNARDRLSIKYKKMLQHQIKMTEQPATQSWLKEQSISSIYPLLHLPGVLFFHWQNKMHGVPTTINKDCKKAQWGYFHEWNQVAESDFTEWRILNKLDWLSAYSHDSIRWYSAHEIKEMIQLNHFEKPVMLLQRDTQERLFMVPNWWPTAPQNEKS